MSYEEEMAWGVQQMLDADLQFPQEVHYSKKPVRTNADHIRSMTDEELAERGVRRAIAFVENGQSGRYTGVWATSDGHGFAAKQMAVKYELNWLKQPYKEDTNG